MFITAKSTFLRSCRLSLCWSHNSHLHNLQNNEYRLSVVTPFLLVALIPKPRFSTFNPYSISIVACKIHPLHLPSWVWVICWVFPPWLWVEACLAGTEVTTFRPSVGTCIVSVAGLLPLVWCVMFWWRSGNICSSWTQGLSNLDVS